MVHQSHPRIGVHVMYLLTNEGQWTFRSERPIRSRFLQNPTNYVKEQGSETSIRLFSTISCNIAVKFLPVTEISTIFYRYSAHIRNSCSGHYTSLAQCNALSHWSIEPGNVLGQSKRGLHQALGSLINSKTLIQRTLRNVTKLPYKTW